MAFKETEPESKYNNKQLIPTTLIPNLAYILQLTLNIH